MKTPFLPCGNCVQLQDKLHKAQEEINSQKLIISLLNEGNKPVNKPHQPQQANLEIDNGSNNDCAPTHPLMPKKMHILHNTLNHEQYKQYAIPTSNRYAPGPRIQKLITGPFPGPSFAQKFSKEQE
jgi:hypothetical protein